MPVRVQSASEEQQYRAADVYLMRLSDSSAAKKKHRISFIRSSPVKIHSKEEVGRTALLLSALSFVYTMTMSRKAVLCYSI